MANNRKNDKDRLDLLNLLQTDWRNKATSIFVWEGLPNRFIGEEIERLLYMYGSCVIFKDDDGTIKVYKWAMNKGLNGYGLPVAWYVFGVNGIDRFLRTQENSVLIWNDNYRDDTKTFINYFVRTKLANIEYALDQQVNALKMPFVFKGEKSQLMTFKNLFKQITDGEPAIYEDTSSIGNAEFGVFPTMAQTHVNDLKDLYDYYEARLLRYLGLEYSVENKKERLITDEVNKNEDNSNSNFASRYNMRLRACEEIEKVLGITVTVKLNPMLQDNNPSQNDQNGEQGGPKNE